MRCYPHFILAARRSRGFASTAMNFTPIMTRFPFGSTPEGLNLAHDDKSSDHYAKGTPSPIPYGIGLRPLVGMWFQVHYPPLIGVLPIFRSRYWFTIGHERVFSLTGWSPPLRTHFHVLSLTQDTAQPPIVSLTGLSPCVAAHSNAFSYNIGS
jgi:hypothetical protein